MRSVVLWAALFAALAFVVLASAVGPRSAGIAFGAFLSLGLFGVMAAGCVLAAIGGTAVPRAGRLRDAIGRDA